MNSNPKILVIKTREIIYTLLLLVLAVLLIVCLVLMFSSKKTDSARQSGNASDSAQSDSTQQSDTSQSASTGAAAQSASAGSSGNTIYTPGVYTASVTLGDSAVDVEVTVDSDSINSVRLVNLSESTSAAFPLVSPALDNIASQILEKQSLENITCPQENRYTSQLLFNAVVKALALAAQQPAA